MTTTPDVQQITKYPYGDRRGLTQYGVVGARGHFLVTNRREDTATSWEVTRDGTTAILFRGHLDGALKHARQSARGQDAR